MLSIKEKERNQILNALKAGVVPILGLRYMQVGRAAEIREMVKDLDMIANGGSTVRFITGEWGAGKSFFIHLSKLMAHEKKLVVVHAEITPEKILCAKDGRARALLTELLKNMSHKSKPEGGGLKSVLETWIGKFLEANPEPSENRFLQALEPLSHLALAQDFAKVLFLYFTAFRSEDTVRMENCIRWFRAEFETRTDAKATLGISRIIEDGDLYDVLQIYAGLCALAGFGGMLVCVDELAVLFRLLKPLRNKNYETILNIINGCHMNGNHNIGYLFGATTDAIENKEKGLHSYPALEGRLAQNRFAGGSLRDLSGPVISLSTLSKEEVLVLLTKIREIHASSNAVTRPLSDVDLKMFFDHTFARMGASAHLNPRDLIREFLSVLSILDDHPEKALAELLPAAEQAPRVG